MGHYLSACALTVAATGDQKLKQKADGIVAELAKCQKALGDSGYLSAFPESFIERAETRQRVWAPYYTLHKIMAGLLILPLWHAAVTAALVWFLPWTVAVPVAIALPFALAALSFICFRHRKKPPSEQSVGGDSVKAADGLH